MEYDSIADTVSFGVAPAILAFSAGHLHELGRTGFVMSVPVHRLRGAATGALQRGAQPRTRAASRACRARRRPASWPSTQWFVSFLREHDVAVQVPESVVAGGVAVLGL